jgi:hypothetical protein
MITINVSHNILSKLKTKGKAVGQIDCIKVQKNAELLLWVLVTAVTKDYDT